jgi:hypothetical protein
MSKQTGTKETQTKDVSKPADVSNQEATTLILDGDPDWRILLDDVTESLSGLTTIRYFVGIPTGSEVVSAIAWKLVENLGGSGILNTNWITLAEVEKVLGKLPSDQPFKAAALGKLYGQASSNSPGFLGACLLHCGQIARSPEGRTYCKHSDPAFWERVTGLVRSGVNLKPSIPVKDKPKTRPGSGKKLAPKIEAVSA